LAEFLNKQRPQAFRLKEFAVKKSLLQSSQRDIFLIKKANVEESDEMKKVAKIIRSHC
jgi:hypothetical protein